MRSWFGGESKTFRNEHFGRTVANCGRRITKLMGEAFKLHSQALVGYEDAMSERSGSPTPGMAARHVPVLDMQTAY